MGFAHDYADAIMHRGRVPMEPVDFVPDWADRPRDAKFYPGAETLPLPEPEPGSGEGCSPCRCCPGCCGTRTV